MLRWLNSPLVLALAALLSGLAVTALVMALALGQPWLGLRLVAPADSPGLLVAASAPGGPAARAGLVPGARVVAIGGHPVDADDLLEEPDMIGDFAAYDDFLARQGALAEALRAAEGVPIALFTGEERHLVPAPRRPPGSLPPTFWIQLLVGVFGFFGGAWILGLRRGGLAEGFLFLAGVGLMISAHAAAIYSTRELALPMGLFRVLSGVNHLGALLFGVGMIGLFMVYPIRLVAPRWTVVPAVVLVGWWVANQARLMADPAIGFQLPATLALLTIAVWLALQYRATRSDPLARAALHWFGLAVLIGAGAFVVTVIVPTLLGFQPALSQGFAFLFFLPIYGGLVLAVARYRLFDLGDWAFRILFYIGGIVALVTLDAGLIALVAMDRIPAFGLSLLAVAMVYLPMRDALARRMLDRPVRRGEGGLFRAVTDVALAPPGTSREARWRAVLQAEFDPLRIEPLPGAPSRPRLAEDGAALELPGVDMLPPLRLEWARGGRGLFSSRDVARAGDLVTMLTEAAASRSAYETGVAAERARIAQDMHDNIGIQLMGALHSDAVARKDALIRETLSDLRDIISNANHADLSLAELLADLRATLGDHLSAAGIALDWADSGEGPARLPPRLAHAMRSILREAVGNALRHSGASAVTVRIDLSPRSLRFSVEDDGRGLGEAQAGPGGGNGLANMRARASGLGGSVSVGPGASGGGTRVSAFLPLTVEGAQV